jgi:hypothetical protein
VSRLQVVGPAMPAIKRLHKACKAFFSPNGPISQEALEQVRTLLGENNKARLNLFSRVVNYCHTSRSQYALAMDATIGCGFMNVVLSQLDLLGQMNVRVSID